MNYKIRHFFLALLLAFIPLSTSLSAQHSFTHPDYHYHLTLRNDWVTANHTPKSLTLIHKSLPSTVNISVRTYSEYAQITDRSEATAALNEIITRHKISYFDGWQNLIERPGTPQEILSAGVLNSHLAVYSQSFLRADLSVDKLIVAEYYYMKPGLLYVLSFQTLMSHWRELQPEIKAFIDSFWVGTGERPQFAQTLIEARGWTMSGGNEANTYVGDSLIQLDHTLAPVWDAPIYASHSDEVTQTPPFVSLILADNLLVASAEKHLYAFAFDTGKPLWDYPLNAPIFSPIAYGNDMIFFTSNEPEPSLFSIVPNDGSIIFKTKLSSPFISDLVYFNQALYLIEDSRLTKINTLTHQPVWKSDPLFNFRWKPVLNKDLIYAVTLDNRLVALAQANGDLRWAEQLPAAAAKAPLLNSRYLAVVLDLQKPTPGYEASLESEILLLNPTTGKKIRSLIKPASGQLIQHPMMDEKVLYALYKLTSNSAEFDTFRMMAYTLNDGKILWQKDILLPANSFIAQPLLSKSSVILNQGLDQNRGLTALDRSTGKEILPPLRGSSLIPQIQSIYGHHTSLILIRKSPQNLNIKVIK